MIDNNRMTVTGLATRIGKSPATVGRWLEIGVMPTIYAEIIADILEIPKDIRYNIFFNGMLPEGQQIELPYVRESPEAPQPRNRPA